MICTTCQQPITLVNSQKNGNTETCLPCAINAAPMLVYTHKRRSEVLHVEIVCQQHYQEFSQPGRDMAPLADREVGAGYTQIVVPYTGDHGCQQCEREAVDHHEKGAA